MHVAHEGRRIHIFLEPLSNFVPLSQLLSTFFRGETYFRHSGESRSLKNTRNKVIIYWTFKLYSWSASENLIFILFTSVFLVLVFKIELLRKHSSENNREISRYANPYIYTTLFQQNIFLFVSYFLFHVSSKGKVINYILIIIVKRRGRVYF